MRTLLFDTIELLSNHKSFKLGTCTINNFWLLLNLKNLQIRNYHLSYQVHNGIRQRKNTKHPVRRMRKKHMNTAELIDYLYDKPYKILQLEILFTNGWKVKQIPYIAFQFCTNSSKERDQLIHILMRNAAQDPIDLSTLEINFTHRFKSSEELLKVDVDDLTNPDEFWSEERHNEWKSRCHELHLQTFKTGNSIPFQNKDH